MFLGESLLFQSPTAKLGGYKSTNRGHESLPTQTSCTTWEIIQVYHTFALFDSPKIGNLINFVTSPTRWFWFVFQQTHLLLLVLRSNLEAAEMDVKISYASESSHLPGNSAGDLFGVVKTWPFKWRIVTSNWVIKRSLWITWYFISSVVPAFDWKQYIEEHDNWHSDDICWWRSNHKPHTSMMQKQNANTSKYRVNTVDVRNPASVDMVNIPSFTGFHTCHGVVWDFFYQQYHQPQLL